MAFRFTIPILFGLTLSTNSFIVDELKTVNRSKNPLDNQLHLLTVMNLMQQDWSLFAGNWYKLFEIELMWIPAENFCRELGGHLVSIRDLAENDFVHHLRKKNNIWIGLNKVNEREGPYGWSDGSELNYLNWDSSQPNEPEVDCCYMAYNQDKRGTWFDYSCQSKLPQFFVCELFLG
ncbi:C-type lectin domain-containing protein [Aphelenchoides besseyi]|nr:C-type lectin domain-containing protein [Aphelenchoides besseyi]KAI6236471.1 C-type lectin domain-containing protein [Aphelenchoides besseyi]